MLIQAYSDLEKEQTHKFSMLMESTVCGPEMLEMKTTMDKLQPRTAMEYIHSICSDLTPPSGQESIPTWPPPKIGSSKMMLPMVGLILP